MNEHFEKGLALFADIYGPEMAEGCRMGGDYAGSMVNVERDFGR